MNGSRNLENLDLELLARIQREQQAEMRQAARVAHQLRGEGQSPKPMAHPRLQWKLAAAVMGALLPIIFYFAQAANAMGAGGGGGGHPHWFM